MLKIVLFDIDHTISNSAWRDNLMSEGWDIYHSELSKDKPFQNMVDLITILSESQFTPIGFTMRPEKWRSATNAWMYKHGVNLSHILMRASDDWSPANTTKMTMIREQFTDEQRAAIQFIVDDRDDVCEMFTREFGISSLQVRHGSK